MNSTTLLLSGVCSVLVAALVWQNRSARTEQAATLGELGKYSNDWKQAVFKLDEQGRLAYTLQTQLKLIQEEHRAATNELPQVKASLVSLRSNHAALADTARSVSNRLHLQLLELTDERGDFEQRLSQLRTALTATESELQRTARQISNTVAQTAVISNAWTQAERAKAHLEAQFQDPTILAAQLARSQEAVRAKPRSEGAAGAERMRIELLPDGSVKQIP